MLPDLNLPHGSGRIGVLRDRGKETDRPSVKNFSTRSRTPFPCRMSWVLLSPLKNLVQSSDFGV